MKNLFSGLSKKKSPSLKANKVAKWSANVLQTIDSFTSLLIEIDQKVKSSTQLRRNAIQARKLVLEKVANYAQYHLSLVDVRDIKISSGLDMLDDEDNSRLKNTHSFHKAVTKLTKALFHLEMEGEAEMDKLSKSATSCFAVRIKTTPVKRQEINRSLIYGRQCICEEAKTIKHYDLLFSKGAPEQSVPLLHHDPPTESQKAAWNQAMGKAQIAEAIRLTDEAFAKANSMLKNMETESREELVRFLYQYVMIGIRYHSSMLSRLTDAFALVKRCETVVSQSSFDVKKAQTGDNGRIGKAEEESFISSFDYGMEKVGKSNVGERDVAQNKSMRELDMKSALDEFVLGHKVTSKVASLAESDRVSNKRLGLRTSIVVSPVENDCNVSEGPDEKERWKAKEGASRHTALSSLLPPHTPRHHSDREHQKVDVRSILTESDAESLKMKLDRRLQKLDDHETLSTASNSPRSSIKSQRQSRSSFNSLLNELDFSRHSNSKKPK